MTKSIKDKTNNIKTFDRQFFKMLVPLMLLIVLFLFFPYWFTSRSWFGIDFSSTGPIGDTIGGILGPFIAIAAAILTFFAFWVQFKANEQQKIDLQIERFENKFYNLIEIHRNNVNEVIIGKSTEGRKAFIPMFNELKFTYLIVKDYHSKVYQKSFPEDKISEDVIYNISYLVFFFGVGSNSSKVVIDLIGEKNHNFFTCVEEFIKKNQTGWRTQRKKGETIGADFGNEVFELDIKYIPCNGHVSILSHYIRNLYQIAKFIEDQDENLIPYESKFQYASTLRSQLSAHEQLLLYYNSLSVLGKPWLEHGLLEKYCIIKSIPIPLADFYKTPLSWLPKRNTFGRTMFEWSDIKDRIKNLQSE
nr:putative phage abortive infection protein [uncultured Draconibacterium sp.]